MEISMNQLRILLIEDPKDALTLDGQIRCQGVKPLITQVSSLNAARSALLEQCYDVALLSMNLDHGNLEILEQILSFHLPVIVLASDDEQALEALRHGAQDYLVKGRLVAEDLCRSIKYAIERDRYRKLEMKIGQVRDAFEDSLGRLKTVIHEIHASADKGFSIRKA